MNFWKSGSKWIWDDKKGVNRYVCFRKEFELFENEAHFYISCDTNYSLWVNGQWADTGQYLSYPKEKFYDVIDVSKYLVKGKNSVCILVYYQGVGSFSYSVGEPGLIYAIKTKNRFIANDGTYTKKASGFIDGEIYNITTQLGPSFSFDARKDENWTDVDFVLDSSWQVAKVCDESDSLPYVIKKRPVKKLVYEKINGAVHSGGEFDYRNKDNNPAVKMHYAFLRTDNNFYKCENGEITVTNDNTYLILDLGAESAGYFNIEMTAPEGVKIDVGYGEHLRDLRVRTVIANQRYSFEYFSKKGYQSFTNYFRRLGLRYLQLHFTNVTAPITIHSVGMQYAKYPVKQNGKLILTDSLDKKIYEVAVKTLYECMHEHYEDCPWREQGLYGFDSRNQGLFGYSVFEKGNYEFAKASLKLMASGIGEDGFLDLCVPTDNHIQKIPAFVLYWVVFVAEYIYYSKDFAFAKEIIRKVKFVLENYFKDYDNAPIKRIKKGEKYWNFYDWQGILSGWDFAKKEDTIEQDTEVLCNLIGAFAVQKAVIIAKACNDSEYEKELKQLFRRLKETINTYFYDEKTGLYNTLIGEKHVCQMAQALALLTGIAKNPIACENALTKPSDDIARLTSSTLIFKYEALLKKKKYHPLLLQEVRRIWGSMIDDGATTFYEVAPEEMKLGTSCCHAWSSVPIFVYEKLFGKFYK